MLPPTTNPKWEKLVTGQIGKFQSFCRKYASEQVIQKN